MIKCVIIDDEPLARMMLKEMLSAYEDIQIIEECGNGFEGLKSIQANRPDLVFLDVQMPKVNGFEMLELIDNPPAVVFVTAFDEYAVQAFEVNAVDYLLKPIDPSRLDKAVAKVRQMSPKASETLSNDQYKNILLPEQTQRIVVKDQGEIVIIPLENVMYLEAADDYVKVH